MVLTQDEVRAVLVHLSGTTWIMATLLYGAGLRLLECLRLRVKDVDFTYNQMVVRDGKGHKDRVTMLPRQVKAPLQRHLHDVQQLHVQDVQAGAGHVYRRMHWSANTPMRVASGSGKMSFLPRSRRGTPGRAASGGITSTTGLAASGADRCPAGRDPKAASCHTLRCTFRHTATLH